MERASALNRAICASVDRAQELDCASMQTRRMLAHIDFFWRRSRCVFAIVGSFLREDVAPQDVLKEEWLNLALLLKAISVKQEKLSNAVQQLVKKEIRFAETGCQRIAESFPGSIAVPEGGLCLSHALVAAQDVRRWLRTPRAEDGHALRAGHRRRDVRRAKLLLQCAIARMEASGKISNAQRLRQPGTTGYPGLAEMPYFAAELNGSICVVPITLGAFEPPTVVGAGPVMAVLGHVVTQDHAGHFVLLDAPGLQNVNRDSGVESE